MTEVNRILNQIEDGDPDAAEELLPLVYDELRKLAAARLSHEKPGQMLQATALVHEAYLRLMGNDTARQWNSRGHFFGSAAEAMRRILVENARCNKSMKRGGDLKRQELSGSQLLAPNDCDNIIALDAALDELATKDPVSAELVNLRYFAGLTIKQAAEALGISNRKADFMWSYARAWLRQKIEDA